MRTSIIWAALVTLLTACGGGGGGGGGGSNPVIVDGVAFKGELAFASLGFHVLEADGSLGEALGGTSTFSRGQFDFLSLAPTPTGYVYVESRGGSYVDESTGLTVSLASSEGLCAIFRDDPSDINVLAITPLTTIMAKRVLALASAGTPLDLAFESARIGVEQQYALPDILGTFPADPTDAAATRVASLAERQYGLVVAGIAELAADMGVRAIDLSTALATDASDGTIDGKLGSAPSQRGDALLLPDLQAAINTIAGRTMGNHHLVGHAITQAPVPLGVSSGGALRFTLNALPAWISGQAGAVTLTAAGGSGQYDFELASGVLPAGFQLQDDRITGAMVLAPGSTHFISAPFTLRVRDRAAPGSQVLLPTHIQVTSPAPQITCLQPPAAQEGVAYDALIATMTGLHPPFYFSGDTLRHGARPPGLIIDVDGRLVGTPVQGTGGRSYTFGVCGVDLIGNQDCCRVTVTVQAPSGGGGGSGCDGTYAGTFVATSPIGPSSGPIQISVVNGVADTVPASAAFGGTLDGACNFTGFWNNCPGVGCVDFPVSGTFATSGQFQLTGQNGTGSESVTITLTRQ